MAGFRLSQKRPRLRSEAVSLPIAQASNHARADGTLPRSSLHSLMRAAAVALEVLAGAACFSEWPAGILRTRGCAGISRARGCGSVLPQARRCDNDLTCARSANRHCHRDEGRTLNMANLQFRETPLLPAASKNLEHVMQPTPHLPRCAPIVSQLLPFSSIAHAS